MQNEITRFDCKQCGSSIGIQEIPASGVIICEACGVSFRIPNLPDKKLNEVKEEVEARIKELSEKQERSDAWNRKRLQQQLDEQMRLLELIRVEKDRAEADRRRNAFNEGVAAQEAGDFDSAVKWFDDVLLNRKDSAPELEVRWRICMCRYEVERVSLTSDGRNWMYTVSNWRDSNFKDNANCRTVLEQSVGKEHEYYERQMDSISGLMAKCADAARDMDCRVVVLADSRNGKMVKEIESALKAENISAYIAFESGDLREAEPKLTAAMSKAQLMIVVTSSDAGVTSPWMTNHWKRWLRSHTKGKSDLMIFAPGVSLKEKQELRSYKPYAEVRTLIRALTKRLGEAKTADAGEETTVSGNGTQKGASGASVDVKKTSELLSKKGTKSDKYDDWTSGKDFTTSDTDDGGAKHGLPVPVPVPRRPIIRVLLVIVVAACLTAYSGLESLRVIVNEAVESVVNDVQEMFVDKPHDLERMDEHERECYDLALEYRAAGQYEDALKMFLEIQHYAIVQNMIGDMYISGDLGIDHAKALEWYTLAEAQGDSFGQYNMGFMYENGFVEGGADYIRAAAYYAKAVKQDNTDAMFALGRLYCSEELGKPNYKKALRLFETPAEQGSAQAQYQLAYMYYNGLGTKINYEKAVEWCQPAADAGNVDAQYMMACVFFTGQGVERDLNEALRWCCVAAERGHVSAVFLLPELYSTIEVQKAEAQESLSEDEQSILEGLRLFEEESYNRANLIFQKYKKDARVQYCLGLMHLNGGAVERDTEKAQEWFQIAIQNGYVPAIAAMGDFCAYGYGDQDMNEAREWYSLAADQGSAYAMYKLGEFSWYGYCGEADQAAAYELYMKAALLGNTAAQYELGEIYRNGYSVPVNEELAEAWYSVAAKGGHAGAQRVLEEQQAAD